MYSMKKSELITLQIPIIVNNNKITGIIIGQHYKENHSAYMNDEIIIQLVQCLDDKTFIPDSTSSGINYYVTDIQLKNELNKIKNYRLIWLLEGRKLEIIGVINAFRTKKAKNKE